MTREVARVSGLQRENANADVAMTTIGVILFWPLLFGMAATKDRKHELGQLKGEYEAIELSARMKQCVPPPPTPGAPQNVVATGAFDGIYSGRGKADSWCQTPSLTLVVKGADLSGELSEVATQAATSAATGTVLGSGAFTLTLKPGGPTYAAGEYEGRIAADTATVDIGPVGGASKCRYRFEVRKRAAG